MMDGKKGQNGTFTINLQPIQVAGLNFVKVMKNVFIIL